MRWLLFLLLTAPVWAQPTLSLQGNARQGNPLFVRVKGATGEGKILWGKETYQTSPEGEAVIPVPVDLKVGPQPLVVELADGTRLERTVTVQARTFPMQYLTIPADTLASYDNPQNKRDDQQIIAALKKFDPVRHWLSNFTYPVDAPQTTGFGDRRLYNGWKKGWHKGLDLGAYEGDPVEAPAAGVVVHTARGIVNGNTVVLSHGVGLGTVYLHLNSIQVKVGQQVEAGQVIGTVGGTGGFAPHLHWEARSQGVPIDPKTLFALPADWR